MSRQYDLIIFDWDGTLMDSVGRIVDVWQHTCELLSLPVSKVEDIKGIIGLSFDKAVPVLFPDMPLDDQQYFVQRYRERYLGEGGTASPLFDGVEPLLADLKQRGHQLSVATGKGRNGLDKALRESGMGQYFDATRTACETASKPEPLMIHELCRQLSVAPERALMVGDAWFDLEMGRRAGSDTVGVTYGAATRTKLATAAPKAIIDRPLELLDWV